MKAIYRITVLVVISAVLHMALSEALIFTSSKILKWRSSYLLRISESDNNVPKRLVYLSEQELIDRIRLSGLVIPDDLNKFILDRGLTGLALAFASDDSLRNLVKNEIFVAILRGVRSVLLNIEENEKLKAIKMEENEKLKAINMEENEKLKAIKMEEREELKFIKIEKQIEEEEELVKAKRTIKFLVNTDAIYNGAPLLFAVVYISSQSQYELFLKRKNFNCLMNTTDNHLPHMYYDYLDLTNDFQYYPLKAVSVSSKDPDREILAISNWVRSRADISNIRELPDRMGIRLDSVDNEFGLVNVNGTTSRSCNNER